MKCGQSDLTRRDEFQKLSQDQQDLITQVLHAQKLLSADLVASIKSSEANITSHLEREAATQQAATAQERDQEEQRGLRRRLLDALAFPEMSERRNMIEGRVADFGSTYTWVFGHNSAEGGTLSHKSYDSNYLDFVHWLQGDDDLFWISGKPGSGKSTLMDFVFHNLQKRGRGFDALKAWAGTTEFRLLSFWFFRPATSVLLKTMQGFWRSLCFQILDVDKTVLETLRHDDDGTAPESLRSSFFVDGSCAQSWTDKELKVWFEYLIAHSSFKYCILVDGLDEVESDQKLLLETSMFLASTFSNVKLLCSSRPDTPFDAVLGSCSSLRVQDFNRRDISLACRERLRGTRAADLAYDVVDRAEGVFLWAHMIAEDLTAAADRGDNEEELKQRLNACPSEMSDLFRHLLERQDIFYTKNPKPYLQVVKFAWAELSVQPTLLEVLIASQDQKELDSVLHTQGWAQYASILNDRAANFETNLRARCMGLVEIIPSSRDARLRPDPDYENLVVLDHFKARFIHRSVLDFLQDSPVASSMSLLSTLSEDDVAARLFDAACIGLFMHVREVDPRLNLAMVMARARHLTSRTCDFKTTERLDIMFTELSNRVEPTRITLDGLPFLGSPTLRVTAPELSLLDNLTYAMAAVHALYPYIHGKTCNLDPERRPIALAVFHCNVLHMDVAFDEAGAIVNRTLNTMQVIRLEYGAYESEASFPTIVSTGYVWEHLAIACASAAMLKGPGFDDDFLSERLSLLCQSLPAVEDDQEHHVEGLLFHRPDDNTEDMGLVPMPDDWSDEQLRHWPPGQFIFQIRLVLRVPQPGHEDQHGIPQFLRLRIADTTRFLPLSSAQNDELQQAWAEPGRTFDVFLWYLDNVAGSWNQCLTFVSSEETAQLLMRNSNFELGFRIYRSGELQEANRERWNAWREELESSRRTQTDPVLLGCLDWSGQKRREEEEEEEKQREEEENK